MSGFAEWIRYVSSALTGAFHNARMLLLVVPVADGMSNWEMHTEIYDSLWFNYVIYVHLTDIMHFLGMPWLVSRGNYDTGAYQPIVSWLFTGSRLLLLEAATKWSPFSRWHFEMYFLGRKWMNFDKNSIEVCSRGLTDNIPVLVQIMAWRRPGDRPLPKPIMVSLLAHIWVVRPQPIITLMPI